MQLKRTKNLFSNHIVKFEKVNFGLSKILGNSVYTGKNGTLKTVKIFNSFKGKQDWRCF